MTASDEAPLDPAAQYQLAARLGATASLKTINLTALTFSADEDMDLAVQMQFAVSYTHGWRQEETLLFGQIHADIAVLPPGATSGGFHITADHVLAFALLEGTEVTEEAAMSFIGTTGVFAVHPYVRELAHLVTVKAGLPALTLDLIRLPISQ